MWYGNHSLLQSITYYGDVRGKLHVHCLGQENQTSASCFSVISTPCRSVFRSGTAPTASLDASIFKKLSFTAKEALLRLSATSNKFLAKSYDNTQINRISTSRYKNCASRILHNVYTAWLVSQLEEFFWDFLVLHYYLFFAEKRSIWVELKINVLWLVIQDVLT